MANGQALICGNVELRHPPMLVRAGEDTSIRSSTGKEPEMAAPRIQLARDPAFDRFLGANVGEDGRGVNVTVLSMLARLGVDPWEEASTLAGMADNPAQKRLGSLMSRFKDVPSSISSTDQSVSDILAYLPRQRSNARPVADRDFPKFALPPQGAPIYWLLMAAFFVAWFADIALRH